MKLRSFLISGLVAVSLAGCSGGGGPQEVKKASSEDKPKTETTTTSSEQKELIFKLGETAEFSSLKVTALEIKKSPGTNQYSMPKEGNVFVGVKFNITNISKKAEQVSSLLLFDGYVDQKKLDTNFITDDAFKDGTLDGNIEPGMSSEGWYAVEVPKDSKTLDLYFKASWLDNDNKAHFAFDLTQVQ